MDPDAFVPELIKPFWPYIAGDAFPEGVYAQIAAEAAEQLRLADQLKLFRSQSGETVAQSLRDGQWDGAAKEEFANLFGRLVNSAGGEREDLPRDPVSALDYAESVVRGQAEATQKHATDIEHTQWMMIAGAIVTGAMVAKLWLFARANPGVTPLIWSRLAFARMENQLVKAHLIKDMLLFAGIMGGLDLAVHAGQERAGHPGDVNQESPAVTGAPTGPLFDGMTSGGSKPVTDDLLGLIAMDGAESLRALLAGASDTVRGGAGPTAVHPDTITGVPGAGGDPARPGGAFESPDGGAASVERTGQHVPAPRAGEDSTARADAAPAARSATDTAVRADADGGGAARAVPDDEGAAAPRATEDQGGQAAPRTADEQDGQGAPRAADDHGASRAEVQGAPAVGEGQAPSPDTRATAASGGSAALAHAAGVVAGDPGGGAAGPQDAGGAVPGYRDSEGGDAGTPAERPWDGAQDQPIPAPYFVMPGTPHPGTPMMTASYQSARTFGKSAAVTARAARDEAEVSAIPANGTVATAKPGGEKINARPGKFREPGRRTADTLGLSGLSDAQLWRVHEVGETYYSSRWANQPAEIAESELGGRRGVFDTAVRALDAGDIRVAEALAHRNPHGLTSALADFATSSDLLLNEGKRAAAMAGMSGLTELELRAAGRLAMRSGFEQLTGTALPTEMHRLVRERGLKETLAAYLDLERKGGVYASADHVVDPGEYLRSYMEAADPQLWIGRKAGLRIGLRAPETHTAIGRLLELAGPELAGGRLKPAEPTSIGRLSDELGTRRLINKYLHYVREGVEPVVHAATGTELVHALRQADLETGRSWAARMGITHPTDRQARDLHHIVERILGGNEFWAPDLHRIASDLRLPDGIPVAEVLRAYAAAEDAGHEPGAARGRQALTDVLDEAGSRAAEAPAGWNGPRAANGQPQALVNRATRREIRALVDDVDTRRWLVGELSLAEELVEPLFWEADEQGLLPDGLTREVARDVLKGVVDRDPDPWLGRALGNGLGLRGP